MPKIECTCCKLCQVFKEQYKRESQERGRIIQKLKEVLENIRDHYEHEDASGLAVETLEKLHSKKLLEAEDGKT